MTSLTGNGGIVSPTGRTKNKLPPGHGLAEYKQFVPEQEGVFQQTGQLIGPGSYLSKLAQGGDEDLFNQIEAPAHRQFASQMGNLASRFSGMGTGARKSSYFQNAATAGGMQFAEQLQANRHQLTRQAMQDLMGYSEQFLNQRPYQQQLYQKPPKKEGFFKSMGKFFSPIYADIDEGTFEHTPDFLSKMEMFI